MAKENPMMKRMIEEEFDTFFEHSTSKTLKIRTAYS